MNTDRKPSWQKATIPDFTSQIVSLRLTELEQLSDEISGSLTLMQSQLEARGKTNIGWWKKARTAMGFIAKKKHLIRAELKSRRRTEERLSADKKSVHHVRRKQALLRIREQAERGELGAAIVSLVDFLDHDAPHRKAVTPQPSRVTKPTP